VIAAPRLVIIVVCWFAMIVRAATAAPEVPRYALAPGQELRYHMAWSIHDSRGKRTTISDVRTDVTIWIIRANSDGSYRAVVNQEDVTARTTDGARQPGQQTTEISYADIFPDGRIRPSKATENRVIPGILFPPLPRDAAQAKEGWEATSQLCHFACKLVSASPDFRFVATLETPFNRTDLETRTIQYRFDAARGFIVKSEDAFGRTSGLIEDGKGTFELLSVKTIAADELSPLANDADVYFAAVESYSALLTAAEKATPDDAGRMLSAAKTNLDSSLAQLSTPDFKAAADRFLKRHTAWAREAIDAARANPIGKPAPAFETTDIDGKKVRLADFHGKVVVLDFWYRTCGWCIAAMPQINELVDDFAGQPVVILGMNVDRDPADARYVIEKMGLKYPTLRAEPLAQKFAVDGFPTLIVIDQQGIIRDVHGGYSKTLRAEVGGVIGKLLQAQ
jgi:peroxiredoxin